MAKTIAILTGGGDVPGLNPAIRAITIRALREGYRVVGVRRGWAGLVDYNRDEGADNSESVRELSEAIVNRAGRTGGTFLHTSRTRPSHLPQGRLPAHLTGYDKPVNDVTKDVLRNLEHIGVDVLIPIGGDDTLSYGKRLHDEGVHVVAIPKTMDNDVYGTDYCIGFSTCVTRTIELTIACEPRLDHTKGFWSSRYSADTRGSRRSCRRWRVQPIAASFRSMMPTSSISPSS
jgi:6-phosphofructokinase